MVGLFLFDAKRLFFYDGGIFITFKNWYIMIKISWHMTMYTVVAGETNDPDHPSTYVNT